MKQFLVFILAFIYLGSSAGATVHLHYCKGQLVDIRVGEKEKGSCSGCKAPKKAAKPCMKSCCKDEHRMLKLEKDHQQAGEVQFKFAQAFFHILPVSYIVMPDIFLKSSAEVLPKTHAPPLFSSLRLHIQHCHFRV
ncbi:HYC_CC_PP family protein [Pseudoflavitalea rhizosphaerae]|uniref:HYC_CC_PP family protein n=1 Tax=Pseudoflavitalea rhizosphaerae TaxID=1884793 RepID=UPI000F8DDAC2|nr:hypothetical protein [Pseudoflavitalea rhizosphaerae]